MKNIAFALLGALVTLAAVGLSSAGPTAAQRGMQDGGRVPDEVRQGGTLFGFTVLKGHQESLSGLGPRTPVTIRKMSGNWIQIDYPTQTTGPVWVNIQNVVTFRTER